MRSLTREGSWVSRKVLGVLALFECWFIHSSIHSFLHSFKHLQRDCDVTGTMLGTLSILDEQKVIGQTRGQFKGGSF